MRTACLLLAAVSMSGCFAYQRVNIASVPEKTAPIAERIKAAKKLLIDNGQQTTYLRNGVPTGTSLDFVLLGDGTKVSDPRDLAAAVEPGSAAAKNILAYEEDVKKQASTRVTTGVVAAVMGGVAAVFLAIGLALPSVNYRDNAGRAYTYADPAQTPLLITSLSVGSLGLLTLMLVGLAPITPATDNRTTAFMMYNKGMLERLALDDESLELEKEKRNVLPVPSARLLPPESWLFSSYVH